MRICIIGLRGLPAVMGGIETHCENLYTRLAKLDPALEIVLLTRAGYPPNRNCMFRGVEIRSLWAPRTAGVEAFVHTFIAILYARIRVSPDIVHLHGIGPGFFSLFSRMLGFTTFVTHHARDFERPKWGSLGRALLGAGEFLTARFAHRIICVSDALRVALVERYPAASARAVTIRSGGSLDKLGQLNDSAILDQLGLEPHGYILAVGRLEATKGFHELVEAYSRSNAKKPLVIAGSSFTDDAYSLKLMQSRSERIRFVGFQTGDALRKLFENTALFIHPSHMEGFGLVIAEALSAGAPVVTTDIPAHREFELKEDSYFPVGDIDAIAGLLSQPNYDRHRSAHACALQRRNSWDSNAAKTLDLIRQFSPS